MSKRQRICERDDCGPENPYCKGYHPRRPCRRGPECQKKDCTFSHKKEKGDTLKKEVIRNGNDIVRLTKLVQELMEQLYRMEDKINFIKHKLDNA